MTKKTEQRGGPRPNYFLNYFGFRIHKPKQRRYSTYMASDNRDANYDMGKENGKLHRIPLFTSKRRCIVR